MNDNTATKTGRQNHIVNVIAVLGVVLTLFGVLGSIRPSLAQAQSPTVTVPVGTADNSVVLSTPTSGQVLFGTIRIMGTVNNAQMQAYRLEFLAAADARAQWQVIASQVTQQVTNGTLGQWDTTKVADGTYQIRLRVTMRNNTVIDAYARGLQVSNQQPTALPTVPPPPTATNLPTLGPSPTALIQQPPTATIAVIAPSTAAITNPAPTTVPLITNADNIVNDTSGQSVSLSFGAIQSALCSGALLAALAFALGGTYVFVRGRLRR